MTTANPSVNKGGRGMQEPSEGYGAQATSQDNLTIKEDNADDDLDAGCYQDDFEDVPADETNKIKDIASN